MTNPFYNGDAPMPFQGVFEEEPEEPGKKRRRVLFTGGMMGPTGFAEGPMYPVLMTTEEDWEEEEDPNP